MEFEQVYDLYFQDVYRYILKLSGSEHIAEEVTSETFFKALHSIGKFRGQCDIRVWLCQIARNCYISSLRKEKRTAPLDELPSRRTAARLRRNCLPSARKPNGSRRFFTTCRSRTGRYSCGGYSRSFPISRSEGSSPRRTTGPA